MELAQKNHLWGINLAIADSISYKLILVLKILNFLIYM
jgi:hypothetical protein